MEWDDFFYNFGIVCFILTCILGFIVLMDELPDTICQTAGYADQREILGKSYCIRINPDTETIESIRFSCLRNTMGACKQEMP